MLIVSLRREARISGEAASFNLLEQLLAELGIPCARPLESSDAGSPSFAAVRRFGQLQRLAAANTTDLLLVKLPTAAQLPFAVLATRGFRGRLIFWIDGLLWRPLSPALMAKLFAAEPLLNAARTVINNGAWLTLVGERPLEIIVASETQRRELDDWLHAATIHVIPNGSPLKTEATATTTAPLPAQRFGYIGHAYSTKGVWDIVDAYRILQERNATPNLLFALSQLGGNSLRNTLIKENIEVLGEVQKPAFYGRLRALIAPYWTAWGTQTFPNILLEAMQFGVPVITTDLPLCRELFPDELGLFVPPNQPAALADTLEAIQKGRLPLPSPDKLRAHFQAHYSHTKIATLWSGVLSRHRPVHPSNV